MKPLAVALALMAVAAEAAAATIVHDGKTRQYLTRRADDARKAAPALFILHGGGIGSADQISKSLAGKGVAPGYIYVFPEGLSNNWNDGRTDSSGALIHDEDDVGFLSNLAERLISEGTIDRDRIYVAGISNGGMMAIRLACERADLFSGIGVVAAAMQTPFDCRPARPTPALFIHGDQDEFVTFDGSMPTARALRDGQDRGRRLSIPDSLAFWSSVNRCASADAEIAIPDRAPRDGATAGYRLYQGCAAPVAFIAVKGGGHTWPGAAQGRLEKRLVGQASQDFDATHTMLAFFETGRIEPAPAQPGGKRTRRSGRN